MARSDSVMYVRLAAVYALDATNRYSSAVTGLVTALDDSAPEVRRAAAIAIARVGAPAQSASVSLARLRADPNADVRQAATHALNAIAPQRP